MLELFILILMLLLGLSGYLAYHFYQNTQNLNKQLIEQSGSYSSNTTSQQKDIEVYLAEMQKVKEELEVTKIALSRSLEDNKSVISSKKSMETRLGVIGENLVPLLGSLPYDPTNLKHLGQPIDFIYFNYDEGEVVLVEVKTNKSKESKRQKTIKNAIKLGKVHYEVLRIDEKGITIKREENTVG